MFVSHVASLLSWAGAAMAVRPELHRYAGNATHGSVVVTTTVSSPCVVTLAMFLNTKPSRMPLRHASMFCFTAAALSGSPSWNLMPERSTIVHVLLSGLPVTDFARYGAYTLGSSVGWVRVS